MICCLVLIVAAVSGVMVPAGRLHRLGGCCHAAHRRQVVWALALGAVSLAVIAALVPVWAAQIIPDTPICGLLGHTGRAAATIP